MNIYEEFQHLSSNDKSEEIVTLLEEFCRNSTLSKDKKAWAYWNISDNLAIMRKPHKQYDYHSEFVEWGKVALAPDELYWFVSDGTQALTLSLGNYFEKWYDWYLYACEHSTKNEMNRGGRFESHRTAIYSFLKLEQLSNIDFSLNNMWNLINEDSEWENKWFAELTYYSLLVEKAFLLEEQTLVKETVEKITHFIDHKLTEILRDPNIPLEQNPFVLGSWEQINTSRLTKRSMTIGLNNVACSLSRMNMHEESVKAFSLAIQNNHKLNTYGLSLYLSSLWKLHQSKEIVMEAWEENGVGIMEANELRNLVPDMQ